jgi:hypothetical protein
VTRALGLKPEEAAVSMAQVGDLRVLGPGRPFEVPPVLFKRIEEADIEKTKTGEGVRGRWAFSESV